MQEWPRLYFPDMFHQAKFEFLVCVLFSQNENQPHWIWHASFRYYSEYFLGKFNINIKRCWCTKPMLISGDEENCLYIIDAITRNPSSCWEFLRNWISNNVFSETFHRSPVSSIEYVIRDFCYFCYEIFPMAKTRNWSDVGLP